MNRFLAIVLLALLPGAVSAQSAVSFTQRESSLAIEVGGKPFATYTWNDKRILRPYFSHLHAPDGSLVTRRHPPVPGQDATDHDTMHPGLWLAFGDLGGADFWRNKATVRHVEFVEKPAAVKSSGRFAVRNRYEAAGKTVCEEVSRYRIEARPNSILLDWTAEFSGPADFRFGDQEEMGLGVRVATPLTVKNGGEIRNSAEKKNEKQVWGQTAAWCDYSGRIADKPVGITLMPDPANFRPCWFHARDYGVLVANPFGRNAFTKQEKSSVLVRNGETFRLRFGILVHSGEVDLPAEYKRWAESVAAKKK